MDKNQELDNLIARGAEAELCRRSLAEFSKCAWSVLEPTTPLDWNWHLDCLCEHLSAMLDDWYAVSLARQAGKPDPLQRIRNLSFSVAPGTGKPCHVDGFVLEQDRGLIRLGEVVVGNNVLTHKGRYREVLAIYEQGELPLYEIQTYRGRIVKVAGDHPLLTTRGWVEAKDLTTDDYLAEVLPQESCGKQTISMEEARLIGYLIGDGYVARKGTPVFTNQDVGSVADFIYCAESIGLQTSVLERPGKLEKTYVVSLLNREDKRYRKAGGDGSVSHWLELRDLVGKNSYTKVVPDVILGGNDDLVAEFLGAYLACDGCIEDRRDYLRPDRDNQKANSVRLSCVTVSVDLAFGLQRLFNRLGLSFTLRRKVKRNFQTKVQGSEYVYYVLNATSQDIVAKFMKLVSPKIRHEKRNRAIGTRRSEFDTVLHSDAVVDIKQGSRGVCRCLTVAEDSTFSYEGVAVHNSRFTSVFAPSWMWLKCPSWRAIFVSGNPRISLRDADYCRMLIESQWYQKLFKPKWSLAKDQNAKSLYRNTEGGFRMATSTGSRIVGDRADALFIDDSIDATDAASEVMCESINDWYDQSAGNRVNDLRTSIRFMIAQRLRENDLPGHVMKSGQWDEVVIPQEYDPKRAKASPIGWKDPRKREGELMFPKRFPKTVIEEEKIRLGPTGYSSQHQQLAVPSGGGRFKSRYFREFFDRGLFYELEVPGGIQAVYKHDCKRLALMDPAGAPKKQVRADANQPCYTVIGIFDVTPKNDILAIGWYREQLGTPETTEDAERLCRKWNTAYIGVESNGLGIGIVQNLQLRGIAVLAINANNSKDSRSETAEIWFAAGKFYFPHEADWKFSLEQELLTYPRGSFVDQVDVISHCCQLVQQQYGLPKPEDCAVGDIVRDGSPRNYYPMTMNMDATVDAMDKLVGRYKRNF